MPWTTAVTRSSGFSVTAAIWNSEHVDNLNYLKRVAYTEFTADVNVTATTVGTANQIVSSGAITYEAVPHQIEFYCPRVDQAAVTSFLILRDGTTVLGTMARMAASQNEPGIWTCRVLTPTAASHTYNLAGYNGAAGTWTYNAGSGGAAGDATTDFPGFIAIYRVPT